MTKFAKAQEEINLMPWGWERNLAIMNLIDLIDREEKK